ncbi:response regulator [Leekyejoonella antrihumi]|uniref:Response regulator transcription factor n=1 Tax=Leekyejoonella antrihumi TaxID=1660198 RepID=A0A563E1I1_9MICO|nr:response regulator transcription factor [Leekyejoonella antrihumi]
MIVDDQPLLRTGFRLILGADAQIDVVGEAEDGAAAIDEASRCLPDVILMDVRMPVMDGVEATRRILATGAASRILILTTFDLDEYAFAGLAAGASGFLLKDVPAAELVASIHVIAGGDAVVSPRVTRALLDRYARELLPDPKDQRPHELLGRLTPREREVLSTLATGLSNAEIAEVLVVSEATVKTHVARLLAKLELRDRVQAVVFAYQHGIVD